MDFPELAALILQQQKNQQHQHQQQQQQHHQQQQHQQHHHQQQQQQQQQQQHINLQILQALKQKEQQDQQRQLLSSFLQLQQKEQAIAQNSYNSVLNSLLANQAASPAVNHQAVLGNSQLNSTNIHSIAPLLIGNRLPTTAQQIGNTSASLNNFQAAHFHRPQPTSPRVPANSFQPLEQNPAHFYQRLPQVLKNDKYTNVSPSPRPTSASRINKNKRPSANNNNHNNNITTVNKNNDTSNLSRSLAKEKSQKISKPDANVVDQAMANYKAMLKANSPTKGCTVTPNNTPNGRTTTVVKTGPKNQRIQDHGDATDRPSPSSSNSSNKIPEDHVREMGTSKKEPVSQRSLSENQQNQKIPRTSSPLTQSQNEDNNQYSGKKHSLEEKITESTVATSLALYAKKRKQEQHQSSITLKGALPEPKDLTTLHENTPGKRKISPGNKDGTKKRSSSVSKFNHSAQVKIEDKVPQRVENCSLNKKTEPQHQNLKRELQTPRTHLSSNDSSLQHDVSVKREGTEARDSKGECSANGQVRRIDSPSVVSQSSSSSANNSTCFKDTKDETRDPVDHEVSLNKSKGVKSDPATNNADNATRPFGYQNPFQTITSEQIEKSIPDNASSVFHVFDRRINLDSHPPGTTFYSLMRSWVKDDPHRAIPQHDLHTLAEASAMSIQDQESNFKIDPRRKPYKKRKITITEDDVPNQNIISPTCDLISQLREQSTDNEKYVTSESHLESEITELLRNHVNASKLHKQEECKKITARMNQHRESLSRIGINLPK